MASKKDKRSGAGSASGPGSSAVQNRKEALRLWQDLTSGRIRIKRYHDERGRRFLILKPLSRAAHLAELSERERQALGYRAVGQSFRQIASELGVSITTVMTDLASARKRLGIASDLELPVLLAAAPRKAAVNASRPKNAATASTNKLRGREIWRLAFRAPPGLRREPPRKAGEQLIISFPVAGVDWRSGLSVTEISVAEEVLIGKARAQIAAKRGTAVRTIVNQIASVFRKLGVSSRLELSLYALTGRHASARRRN
jgi:DNA-binding CsgD family transcriptional regulator